MKTLTVRSSEYDPLNDFQFYKVMGEKGDEVQLLGFLNAVLGKTGSEVCQRSIDTVANGMINYPRTVCLTVEKSNVWQYVKKGECYEYQQMCGQSV